MVEAIIEFISSSPPVANIVYMILAFGITFAVLLFVIGIIDLVQWIYKVLHD